MLHLFIISHMSHYTFQQYADNLQKTTGIHNTAAYSCLTLIGELGELIEAVVPLLPPADATELPEVRNIRQTFTTYTAFAQEAEKLKKSIRIRQLHLLEIDEKTLDRSAVEEELGGILWYLNRLSIELGTSLETVAQKNTDLVNRRFAHDPQWMVNGNKIH